MQQSNPVHIRQARETDREVLAEMWVDFLREQAGLDSRFVVAEDAVDRWRNDFPEWLGASVFGMFVAETGSDLVGFVSVHLWYPAPIYRPQLEAYLDELFVLPGWRRRGVATALLGAVRQWARARDAHQIRLGVLSANQDAFAFWRRCGASEFVDTLLIDV